MLHLTPTTLQGHTVGKGIKALLFFLSIPFHYFFFLFLEGKEGEGRVNGDWELAELSPTKVWMPLLSSQSGKLEVNHEQIFTN